VLPNLVIIGAPKCGTTSLHAYLDQHPDIAMARPKGAVDKEMRYFWRDDWRDRRAWYERHFDSSAAVRGEATPAYSSYPRRAGVPERIHSLVPGAKLIYVVRDPIARIASQWVQSYADGRTRTSFEDALRDYDRPDHPLVCQSKYATQIDQYLRYFSPSQLLVVDHHELKARRPETLTAVFEFLGVDPTFHSPVFEREWNRAEEKYALTERGERVWNGLVAPAVGRLPDRARQRARPLARRLLRGRKVSTPAVQPELRERLAELLQPEVDRLRSFTGKQFPTWSL
jgi:hypothetical protein